MCDAAARLAPNGFDVSYHVTLLFSKPLAKCQRKRWHSRASWRHMVHQSFPREGQDLHESLRGTAAWQPAPAEREEERDRYMDR